MRPKELHHALRGLFVVSVLFQNVGPKLIPLPSVFREVIRQISAQRLRVKQILKFLLSLAVVVAKATQLAHALYDSWQPRRIRLKCLSEPLKMFGAKRSPLVVSVSGAREEVGHRNSNNGRYDKTGRYCSPSLMKGPPVMNQPQHEDEKDQSENGDKEHDDERMVNVEVAHFGFLERRHRASAALFAWARRSSGDTPDHLAFAPFLPPSRPQARKRSSAASIAGGRFLLFAIEAKW
jgi:hypothetical protein